MLTVVREQGQLVGVCEWWLVNQLGEQDWKSGTTVWVEQLELSKHVHAMNIIRQLIDKIGQLVPRAAGAYWVRKDKTVERLHAFTRMQLVEEEVMV